MGTMLGVQGLGDSADAFPNRHDFALIPDLI
jgi:hypothetical protein